MKGFTLIELLVALGIASVVILGAVGVSTTSVSNVDFSQKQGNANSAAQATIEWLRGERDESWDIFLGRAGRTWCLQTLSWSQSSACSSSQKIDGTDLIRNVTLSQISTNEIMSTVIVYWTDSKGRHEVKLENKWTRWQSFISGGSIGVSSTPTPTPAPTPPPVPTPSPSTTPSPTPSWQLVEEVTAGCNFSQSLSVVAQKMRLTMISGGGDDDHISFNCCGSGGAKWTAGGTEYKAKPSSGTLDVGNVRETDSFGDNVSVSLETISVGCNDGETGTFRIERYGP